MLCIYIELVEMYYLSINGWMLSKKFSEKIILFINKMYHGSLSLVQELGQVYLCFWVQKDEWLFLMGKNVRNSNLQVLKV